MFPVFCLSRKLAVPAGSGHSLGYLDNSDIITSYSNNVLVDTVWD